MMNWYHVYIGGRNRLNEKSDSSIELGIPGMKHKYADAIVAWAYGEPIQYKGPYPDCVWEDSPADRSPCFDVGEWRPKPKKKKGWINIFVNDNGTAVACSSIWESKEIASMNQIPGTRIACIEIEFEEGEGL